MDDSTSSQPAPGPPAPPAPYEPGPAEQNGYYYGLRGDPKLVARTGHNRWVRPETTEGPYTGWHKKYYVAITDHELIAKWTEEVNLALMQALQECQWSFFFPIRMAVDSLEEYGPQRDPPTVLLIGVVSNSLEWDQGIKIALSCREILVDFHLDNIQVEIREGEYTPQTTAAALEELITPPQSWSTGLTNKICLPLLRHIGYSVGYLGVCSAEGAIGLHLRLGDPDSALYGLTCRHVVAHDRPAEASFRAAESNPQYHIHPSQKTLDECLGRLDKYLDELKAEFDPLQARQDKWDQCWQSDASVQHRPLSENESSLLEQLRPVVQHAEQVASTAARLLHRDKAARKIGSLQYHPKLEIATKQREYLKDWGLLKLDDIKPGTGSLNQVLVHYPDDFDVLSPSYKNGFLSLHLPSPEAQSRAAFPVAKRGPATGLTVGKTSGVLAVVRRQPQMPGLIAREMVIVPSCNRFIFSDGGDSGSIVFDGFGAVRAMVNGGIANPGSPPGWGAEVTFASPIQWILDDIHEFTGKQPSLA